MVTFDVAVALYPDSIRFVASVSNRRSDGSEEIICVCCTSSRGLPTFSCLWLGRWLANIESVRMVTALSVDVTYVPGAVIAEPYTAACFGSFFAVVGA